jgi:DNA-binding NarL/FixJ family response regulator
MSLKPYVLDGPKELTVKVRLTERERQVLELTVAGKQHKEIAVLLNMSVRTVKHFTQVLYLKLGVSGLGRAALAATALRNGLVK